MNWDDVFAKLDSTEITEIYQNPVISHTQFIDDLKLLQTTFPDKYLQSTHGPAEVRDGLSDLLGPQKELQGFYCKQLHSIAELIRICGKIPGYEKLQKQLPSDRPFMNQLHASCYWSQVFGASSIEQDFGDHDADIVSDLDLKKLKIHVKTIDQMQKSQQVFRAVGEISYLLTEHNNKSTEGSLGISLFEGVVPSGMNKEKWSSILKDVDLVPGVHKIQIDNDHEIKLQLECCREGKIIGSDVFRNLPNHRLKIQKRVPNDDNNINILLNEAAARQKDVI